ncbi:hypothetical protein J7T55_005382 [Diaporthe amygdali]|uniref:uncharacterized protein n=1 Tax=Phomopsis amygdali TaxID=1214568 RepID=UPI0022FDF8AE|nr:uncharacterized protein J7T55_005382 [Diaporthe amygdali]KAJ0108405.1 hypothetical protein J7T55_005382 [Diaporthe amygdali]
MASQENHLRPTAPKKQVSYTVPDSGPSAHHDYEAEHQPSTLNRESDEPPASGASEKPFKDDLEAGSPTTIPRRPTIFNRTFTQQFRAGVTGEAESEVDFSGLSQKEKRKVVKTGMKSYFLDTNFKNHIIAALGEFVGTTMFLFFAFTGTAVATVAPANPGFDISVQTYIALCFGFSLMVNVWVFYRISGGLFNPAVTLALVLIRAITPIRGVFVFVAQLLGGIAAAGLASCMFPTDLSVSTTLSDGVSLAQGVFIEAILTFELVFTIFMLAAEKHRATFIAPVGIGLALFIAEMSGVYYTGGSLNPARSLGPCVIAASFPSEHWIYWVGPFLGSLVAFGLYKAIKLLRYEMANPGQDSHE